MNLKTHIVEAVGMALVVMFAAQAPAQTVGDPGDYSNESHTIDGVTENVSGIYYVGDEGSDNALTILNGGKLTGATQVILGNAAGSGSNEALVTGAGSEIANSSFFIVGSTGSYNQVTVAAGAKVTSSDALYVGFRGGSHNLVVVTNQAEWYHTAGSVSQVGLSGGVSNRLVVTDGGLFSFYRALRAGNNVGSSYNSILVANGGVITQSTAHAEGFLYVGTDGATHNEIRISGNQSAIYARDVRGQDGGAGAHNQLVIEDGGLLSLTRYLRVGEHASSVSNHLVVTDSGSRLLVPNRMVKVGHAGSYNTMTVSNGASVLSQGLVIGRDAGAVGNQVTLTGAGTTWTNVGIVTVSTNKEAGNILRIQNNATMETDKLVVYSNGTLELTGGKLTYAEDFNIQLGGTLAGSGTIEQLGTTAEVGGTLSPGHSAGTLTFEADLKLLAGSTVLMELGGTTAGVQSDLIVADSIEILGGTLVFSFLDSHTLNPHDEILIFDAWGGVSGAFGSIDQSALPSGWSVNTDKMISDGIVTVIPEPSTVTLLLLAAAGWILRRRLRAA